MDETIMEIISLPSFIKASTEELSVIFISFNNSNQKRVSSASSSTMPNSRIEVGNQDKSYPAVRRYLAKELLKCFKSPGGSADADDGKAGISFLLPFRIKRNSCALAITQTGTLALFFHDLLP